MLEALLFAATSRSTRRRWPSGCRTASMLKRCLPQLQTEYAPRGVNLVRVANKWTFRTASDLSWLLTRESTGHAETVARGDRDAGDLAYHQPVTRAEIEEIRGVITSKGTLDVLLETGWIRPRGRRKTPGRPLTFGTTRGLPVAFRPGGARRSAGARRAEGLGLDRASLPSGFSVPMPSDDPALREDEDPLEPGDLDLGWRRRPTGPRNKPQFRQAGVVEVNGSAATALRRLRLFLTPPSLVSQLKSRLGAGAAADGGLHGFSEHLALVDRRCRPAAGVRRRGKISDLMGDVAKGIKAFKKGMPDDEDGGAKVRGRSSRSTIRRSDVKRRADADSKVCAALRPDAPWRQRNSAGSHSGGG